MPTSQEMTQFSQEALHDYVAELQLHMTLHARNLIPRITEQADSRSILLQEAQAMVEKHCSRQQFEH